MPEILRQHRLPPWSGAAFVAGFAAELGASRAATSAFFALAGLTFSTTGALTGRLSDRFGPRVVVGTGAIVMGAGLAGTAFIERMAAVGYLTYRISVSVGVSCACVPTLATAGLPIESITFPGRSH
jgi:MFS family permease